jgi:hypothetical protein
LAGRAGAVTFGLFARASANFELNVLEREREKERERQKEKEREK